MAEPWSAAQRPSGYEPPPAFAPPPFRVAPLNETEVLGRTTYPHGPYARPPYPATYSPSRYPPVPWHPTITWQPAQQDKTARRRRTVSIVTAAAVVTALVAIVVVLVTGSTGTRKSRSLTLPETVDEYSRLSTISGTQLRGLFASGGGATFGVIPPEDLAAAKVALYDAHDEGQPSMIFIGFTADDSPSVGAQLHSEPADHVADDVLDGAGSGNPALKVDAGPLGGALKCAAIDVDGEGAVAGVWADHDTLGIVLIIDPAASTGHASSVTRDFRAKAEH